MSLVILFVRALIPLMRAPPSRSNYLSETPHSNTITLGVRASTCAFEEDTNIQCIAPTQNFLVL